MNRRMEWVCVTVVLLACAACLPEAPSATADLGAPPREVRVRDTLGGPWAADDVPRAPVIELVFDTAPKNPDTRTWLVQGEADPDTLEDLLDPPLRAATQRRLVPLVLSEAGRTVRAAPTTRLAPGQRLSLVFAHGAGEAFTRPLRVSTSPVAGASLAATLPAEGDARVAPDTRRVLLVFDGYVEGLDGAAVSLVEEESGKALATTLEVLSCRSLGLPEGDCAWVRPRDRLAARRSYRLHVGPGLKDATGAELSAVRVTFSTREGRDAVAPSTIGTACAPDEVDVRGGCLLASERAITLRGALDEPALVSLSAGERRASAIASTLGFELTLTDLEPGASVDAVLRGEDLSGNVFAHVFRANTAFGLPTISIDEIRADPLGPEPAQEYVELLNFGPEPTSIMGHALTDDAFATGRVIQTPLVVEPGERVLVVSPTFDARDSGDGELPAGVRLARLDGPLSLRNDGAVLILRDALARRISAAPRLAASTSGQCVHRVSDDPRSGASDAFTTDPNGACSPGRATSPAP